MYILDIETILVFLVVFWIVTAYWNARRTSGLPPGPPGYPFVGNLPIFWRNDKLHLTLHNYRKRYGSLVALQLGWYPAIVISCPKLLHEAFIKFPASFSNRPNHFLFFKITGHSKGIINTHGPVWKTSRQMFTSTLRDFARGKSSRIEAMAQLEAQAIIHEFAKYEGKPVHIEHIFSYASADVIFSVVFGKRYDYNDEEFLNIVDKLCKFFLVARQFHTSLLLPYLLPMIFVEPAIVIATKLMFAIQNFANEQIKEHRKTFDKNHIRDFVDVYLAAELEQSGDEAVTEANMFFVISDLLMAGTETTSTTLRWALYFMIKYPHVQEKCIQHIQETIGDRPVCLSDKDNVPYVEATLCEIQRLSNIVPHSVLHCTNGPVEFHGFTFPDKTIIIPDLYSIHMDTKLWNNPHEFNPDRFLNKEGNVQKPTYFIPFSMGKRICAGENLAKTELFIFFTTLLQKFRFTVKEDCLLPDIDQLGKLGVTLYPLPFEAIATPL